MNVRIDFFLLKCECSHSDKKEVSDKMMIVDAMEFAYTHLDGASICFITSNVDFAYVLSKLNKSQWNTIVISQHPRSDSLLYANCDLKLQWDVHILGVRSNVDLKYPPGLPHITKKDDFLVESSKRNDSNKSGETYATPKKELLSNLKISIPSLNEVQSTDNTLLDLKRRPLALESGPSKSPSGREDFDLLLKLIEKHVVIGQNGAGILKCHLSSILSTQYSQLFSDKDGVENLILDAIKGDIVVEGYEQDSKVLYSREMYNRKANPIPLSKTAPIVLKNLSQRILDKTKKLPYVLFVPKISIRKGCKIPDKIMVQSYEKWLLLMFPKLKYAHLLLESETWLSCGTLINWHEVSKEETKEKKGIEEDVELLFNCVICKTVTPTLDQFISSKENYSFCKQCFINSSFWSVSDQNEASSQVIALFQMLVLYDDFFVSPSSCRKWLVARHPKLLGSRSQASLWIDAAISAGEVTAAHWKPPGGKSRKVLCLKKYQHLTTEDKPHETFSTTKEEDFIHDLLLTQLGDETLKSDNRKDASIDKALAAKKLISRFPQSMNTPFKRMVLFNNASRKGRFYVARGYYNQIVGLSLEEAQTKLMISAPFDESNHKVNLEDESSSSLVDTLDYVYDDFDVRNKPFCREENMTF